MRWLVLLSFGGLLILSGSAATRIGEAGHPGPSVHPMRVSCLDDPEAADFPDFDEPEQRELAQDFSAHAAPCDSAHAQRAPSAAEMRRAVLRERVRAKERAGG